MWGGARAIEASYFVGNTVTSATGKGGAIYNDGGLLVQNTTLEYNRAWSGGAIYNTADDTDSNMLINFTTLIGNSATNGGAVTNEATTEYASFVTFVSSRAQQNHGVNGSALFNRGSQTHMYDTTIVNNNANAINNASGEVGLFASNISGSTWANCVGTITLDSTLPNVDSDGSCQ